MKLLSIFNQNSNAILTTKSMSCITGGKRMLEAARAQQQTLVEKVQRKASRKISGDNNSFDFRFEGQTYSATYDASSKMLHVMSASGEEVCVEW